MSAETAHPRDDLETRHYHPDPVSPPESAPDPRAGLTELLRAASTGDRASQGRLLALIGDELRSLARREAARWRNADARPTALVNELYLRLFGSPSGAAEWPNRRYFFVAAARALHEIMIEQQRRIAVREPPAPLPADWALPASHEAPLDLLDLRLALEAFERVDRRAADVFRLRSLLDMTIEEVAAALAIGHATVERDYRFARTWLRSRLADDDPPAADEATRAAP